MKCSRDVYIKPDSGLSDVASKSFDAVVLPGGAPGAKALAEVRTDYSDSNPCLSVYSVCPVD